MALHRHVSGPSGQAKLGMRPQSEFQLSAEVDEVLDASLYAIFKFHLFEVDDPRVTSTMSAVEEMLAQVHAKVRS